MVLRRRDLPNPQYRLPVSLNLLYENTRYLMSTLSSSGVFGLEFYKRGNFEDKSKELVKDGILFCSIIYHCREIDEQTIGKYSELGRDNLLLNAKNQIINNLNFSGYSSFDSIVSDSKNCSKTLKALLNGVDVSFEDREKATKFLSDVGNAYFNASRELTRDDLFHFI